MHIKLPHFKLRQDLITKISEDVWGIVLPLSFSPYHVNIWFLKMQDGWAVFDCGFNSPEVMQIWEDIIFKQVHPIKHIIMSHFHLDHAGLCGWVASKTNAQLYATYREWFMVHFLKYEQEALYVNRIEEYYKKSGVAEKEAKKLSKKSYIYPRVITPLPDHFEMLENGDHFGEWQIKTVRGHSQEMVTLFHEEKNILISCDHLLPNITPNISVLPIFDHSNPLQDYLDDLEPFRQFTDTCLILPSHGKPFYGLSKEIERNIGHHEARFLKILEICKTEKTGFEITKSLFKKKYDPSFFFYFLGETLSHITVLLEQKKLSFEVKKGINIYKTP